MSFEDLMAELVRRAGFEISSKGATDGSGMEIVATSRRAFFQGTYIILCKPSSVLVEESAIRALYGMVMSERANKGILITNSAFAPSTVDFANRTQIELIDGQQLLKLLTEYRLIGAEGRAASPAEAAAGTSQADAASRIPAAAPAGVWKSAREVRNLNSDLMAAAQMGDAAKVGALLEHGADPNAKDKLGTTVLHLVALWGHADLAQILIAKGANVNAKDDERWTPLHVAAMKGHKGVVELLLGKGAGFNVIDRKGKTPLDLAKENGRTEVVTFLRNFGARVNLPSTQAVEEVRKQDATVLVEAIKTGDREKVAALLDEGADLKTEDEGGNTPLHLAAGQGHADLVELLLAKGANAKAKNNDGLTPLFLSANTRVAEILLSKEPSVSVHAAALSGNAAVMAVLIARGAPVNSRNEQDSTPLDLAALRGHKAIVELLLEKGANPDTKDKIGSTPLHWAAYQGHAGVVEALAARTRDINARNADNKTPLEIAKTPEAKNILRKYGAWVEADLPYIRKAVQSGNVKVTAAILDKAPGLVNATDKDAATPLHIAAFQGNRELVDLLVQRGASVNAMGKKRESALHLATLKGSTEIAQTLIAHGADINARGQKGETPLHFAAVYGHKDLAAMLIAKGALVGVKNELGTTPLHLAAWRGPIELVELLVTHGAQVNAKDEKGNTPVDWANMKNRKDIAQFLVGVGGKPGKEIK